MGCDCNLRKQINRAKIELDKRDIYLDYNSTTKPDIKVLAEVEKFNRLYWGNPSAQNSRGVKLFNLITTEFIECLTILNSTERCYYFSQSSSSIINDIKDYWQGEILTSSIEHKSLLSCGDIHISVDNNGIINADELKKSILNSTNPILIYSPVNHETGNIQPIKEIYNLCRENNVPIILDVVQTISRLHSEEWSHYCNGFYYSGHKIYALPGAATLIIDKDLINFKTDENPLHFSLYNGTFNTPAVHALTKGTLLLLNNFDSYHKELTVLDRDAQFILNKIVDYKVESSEQRAPGIINLSLNINGNIEDLLMHLNQQNIQIGRISACSGNINEPSYVLKEMGRDSHRASHSLRISFGKGSKRDDFYKLVSSINNFLGLQ